MAKNENKKPPCLAAWILYRLSRQTDRHSLLDDLEIEYKNVTDQTNHFMANVWYGLQVAKACPDLICLIITGRLMMFHNYFKTTFRNLKRYKAYSLINIFGLAIGMACCILILMWVQDELSFDKFHENGDNLYRLTVKTPSGFWESSPWALMPTLKKDFPEIIKGSWFFQYKLLSRYQDNVYYENYGFVGPDFFEMFTFPFIKGDPKTAFPHVNSVVLTSKTARKYFGDIDPMGKTLQLENQIDLTVTGIIQDVPANSHLQFDLLAHPVVVVGEDRMRTWSADCASYVQLHNEADPEIIAEKIKDTINKYDKRTNVEKYVGLQPFKKIHLYALNGTDPILYVTILSLIALLILLIACINYMNLSTARSSTRAREVAMRKVVGAGKSDIIRQFFSESIILSCLALLMALLLVYLFLPRFNLLVSKQLTLNLTNNLSVVYGLIVIAIMTGIVSGSYPALILSNFHPIAIMKNNVIKGSKGHLFRRILIVFQFSTAIILIISTSTIYKQMQYIRNKDLGFNREQIIVIRTNRTIRRGYDTIKENLLNNSHIVHVSAASSIPLGIGSNNPVYWEGRGPEQYEMINFCCVDYDYFETFNMEMAHGRSFSREFPTDRENYIINEAALKLTGYEDPVGRMFSMWTAEGQIIGVVKDFHGTSLHNDIRPIVFMLYQNLPYFYLFIKISTAHIPETITYIKQTMTTMVPDYPFEYQFLDEQFDQQYKTEKKLGNILKYFTCLAIVISCLGLLGLAAFMAETKTREIAIRKVLGAKNTTIVTLLSKEFLFLIMAANAIAWPAAYYFVHTWIHSFAYHTKIGIWVFAIGGIVALIITQLTVSYQALKAASTDPVYSLRHE